VREFVAEVVSIGRLRHRNLVQLLGYCRRKDELLLVYDYMSNGSLEKYLHDPQTPAMFWPERYSIIKGVAAGLLYLHEGLGESRRPPGHKGKQCASGRTDEWTPGGFWPGEVI